jgi:hypothetical protein
MKKWPVECAHLQKPRHFFSLPSAATNGPFSTSSITAFFSSPGASNTKRGGELKKWLLLVKTQRGDEPFFHLAATHLTAGEKGSCAKI